MAGMLEHIQFGSGYLSQMQFKIKIETFFCVDLGNVGNFPDLTYQHLSNIALGLLHTSYAFLVAGLQLNLKDATCSVFQSPSRIDRLKIERYTASRQGGQTFCKRTVLYDNNGLVHSPQNIVHEIGHFLNYRLDGAIPNTSSTSPLGRLVALQMTYADGTPISFISAQNNLWQRGPGLGANDPWQQNPGTSYTDNSERANEEVADLFLNWIYDKTSPVFVDNNPGGKPNPGSQRRLFVNNNIVRWVSQLFREEFPLCNP
jgi:hypothetical protein